MHAVNIQGKFTRQWRTSSSSRTPLTRAQLIAIPIPPIHIQGPNRKFCFYRVKNLNHLFIYLFLIIYLIINPTILIYWTMVNRIYWPAGVATNEDWRMSCEGEAEYFCKDFDWEEVRSEVEANPRFRYHFEPASSSSSYSTQSQSPSPDSDVQAWKQFHTRHASGKFFKVQFFLSFFHLRISFHSRTPN